MKDVIRQRFKSQDHDKFYSAFLLIMQAFILIFDKKKNFSSKMILYYKVSTSYKFYTFFYYNVDGYSRKL